MCKEVESPYIEAVKSSKKKCIEQELIFGNKPVVFKLDTGAECNVLPEKVTKELIDCQVEPTNTTLRSFGGDPLNTVGKCFINTCVQGHNSPILVEYYVVRHDVKPILIIESCLRLGLISISGSVVPKGLNVDALEQKSNHIDEFDDVFTGLGWKEGEYNISLSDGAKPTIQPQRNIPLRLLDK